MRLVGALLVLLGLGTIYELYYKGNTIPGAVGDIERSLGLPANALLHPLGGSADGTSPATNASQATSGTLKAGPQ